MERFIHDYWGNMNPNSLGQYVRYEDYEKLKRERDELHEKFLEFALFTQDFVKRHFPQ